MITYFILYVSVAVWIFLDSKKREFNGIPYAVATCFLGPFVAPVYLAKRNLKEDEMREGGTAWNILKNFALFWTATIFVVGIASIYAWMVAISKGSHNTGAEAAGAAIGTVFVFGILLSTWFFPMVCALVLGFFLKKASIVETGPTGALAVEEPQDIKKPSPQVQAMPEPVKSQPKQLKKPQKQAKINWFAIGKKHIEANEYKEAVAAFSNSLKTDLNNEKIYYLRAVAYSKLADRRNALEDIKTAARLGHPKAIEYLQKNPAK
ncbi:MAG: tetratricopeptide repeat protein [Candidatus Electronema sp. V4]|uniref:tetratricopeptide repeat protein n=1 Tax=Candidatus Electronema sp. V4 TaxID=3454756 RepID=UPI00405576FD